MKIFTYLTGEGESQIQFEVSEGQLIVDGESFPCDGRSVWVGGRRIPFWTHQQGDTVSVWLDGEVFSFKSKDPRQRGSQSGQGATGTGQILAQMPGKVLSLAVQPGDRVRSGQNLLVMESMKMELALDAPCDGVVEAVEVTVGQLVSQGDLLIRLEGS